MMTGPPYVARKDTGHLRRSSILIGQRSALGWVPGEAARTDWLRRAQAAGRLSCPARNDQQAVSNFT